VWVVLPRRNIRYSHLYINARLIRLESQFTKSLIYKCTLDKIRKPIHYASTIVLVVI